ncbi:hypothetical protein HYPBUDRAFT_4428 [Hyphopichia burtonii NRRL Y-1933]|uniref:Uncharacterized protein n=1 Tax=Hyphopichia burtonii NRRL Y-1933 TaxID=984485 RepID=A0A1E4RM13_9ASCO|nr:hypothetical protein HYPBUDRAFT_4428 [Hyphopichia burtonii NRRL Y-1933]ODV68304.1 hypothetical protein HYPBUDRAFT_4428 [Hyphopichia burtonii NRRL Y-1933]
MSENFNPEDNYRIPYRDKYDIISEGLNDNMCAFIEMNGMTISEEDDGYDERVDYLSEILELWAKINKDLNNNQSDTIP